MAFHQRYGENLLLYLTMYTSTYSVLVCVCFSWSTCGVKFPCFFFPSSDQSLCFFVVCPIIEEAGGLLRGCALLAHRYHRALSLSVFFFAFVVALPPPSLVVGFRLSCDGCPQSCCYPFVIVLYFMSPCLLCVAQCQLYLVNVCYPNPQKYRR